MFTLIEVSLLIEFIVAINKEVPLPTNTLSPTSKSVVKEVLEPVIKLLLTAIDAVPEAAVNPSLAAPTSFQYFIPRLSPFADTAVLFSTNCTALNLSPVALALVSNSK